MIRTAQRTGMLDPAWLAAFATSATVWGSSSATPYAASAIRFPNRIAVTDDYGWLTYRQLEWRATRVAAALRAKGLERESSIGILCRNHRGFVEANLAATKIGVKAVLLNTGLPPAQLAEVIEREEIKLVIADRDLADRVDTPVVIAAPEDDRRWSFPDLPRWRPLVQVPHPLKTVDPLLLTSGTTGAPKGANRSVTYEAAMSAFGFLEAVPFARADVTVLPAPLFHAWGFSQMILAATLSGTIVLRRNFDPALVLDDIEAHGATVLAAVPVMLHRILDVADRDRDLSSLNLVATSGSALPGDLSQRWMDRFGDKLYNVYGSTEVGQVSVATPTDMRNAPGTAGKPLRGIRVQVVDDYDDEVVYNEMGNIVIESAMHFDGYTSGETKQVIDGFMATGDRGYVNRDGLIFVDGRADDMIISGGENVFPSNIERSLLAHDAVREAVVVGVSDADLGQKVRAVVVVAEAPDAALTKSLKAHLKGDLAAYEVPREFVYVSELPRNVAGKVLRRELAGARTKVPNRLVSAKS